MNRYASGTPHGTVNAANTAKLKPFFYPAALLATGIGYGIADAHTASSDHWDVVLLSLAFGYFWPRRILVSSTVLAVCLYLVHCFCIAYLDYKQPFVEKDLEHALSCLELMPASLIFCGVGACVAWVVRNFQSAWRDEQVNSRPREAKFKIGKAERKR